MQMPLLTVIIPVRDEEKNIAKCLDSLLNQSFKDFDIVVVSDESIDRTEEIVENYKETNSNIFLLKIQNKPEGWIGKNYALFLGQQYAKGEFLLFLDADVELNEKCIEITLNSLVGTSVNIISYAAYQECKSLVEYTVQPLIFHVLNNLYPLEKISSNKSKITALNGIFIMISRENYKLLGTHEAIKDKILEDVEFAKIARKQNLNISFSYAPQLIKVRMYDNFKDLFIGWSKNFYALLGYSKIKSFALFVLLNVVFNIPLFLMLLYPSYGLYFSIWLIFIILYFCFVYHKMGYRFYMGFLFPPGSFILSLIILQSFINYVFTGSVKWKNRTYKVN